MNNFNQNEPTRRNEGSGNKANTIMRAIFGIIMIIIYVGMGVLLLINFFGWDADWAAARYIVGVMLVIYGVWRAYRQIKGID
ncbi:MAG: hypothetical protein K2I69_06700 [Muribaculaceae bacterium]|nr:hypothetical protein [Muribaculaceae bacterium]MDE6575276.1 hypothetical protein [Muribaculaceae bacterium]